MSDDEVETSPGPSPEPEEKDSSIEEIEKQESELKPTGQDDNDEDRDDDDFPIKRRRIIKKNDDKHQFQDSNEEDDGPVSSNEPSEVGQIDEDGEDDAPLVMKKKKKRKKLSSKENSNSKVSKNKEKKKKKEKKRKDDDEVDEDDEDVKVSEESSSDSDDLESDDEREDSDNAAKPDDEDVDDEEVDEDEDEEDATREVDEEESDYSRRRGPAANDTIYDFDIMMAKKKEENSRKRRRRGYDIINDNDDIIADIINQMKDAVEADNESNSKKQAATKKLKLLPFIVSQLRKVDLRDAFLDSDVLSVITEWLAPLPDRSLPHIQIRESLIKILLDFNLNDVDRIKSSGIGKAIMYLYKHPKESKENKQRAKELISMWSRPIFQLESNFSSVTREEREERDLELRRRMSRSQESSDNDGAGGSARKQQEPSAAEPVAKKPGDKGWIPRARVPAPSMKDYVIRPRSKVDADIGKNKRSTNMLDKYLKSQQDRRRASKQQRAVNMKIDRI